MEFVSTTLNSYLRGAKPTGPNADIARWMLAHLDTLDQLRVVDVAEACYVSKPTVIRFVRELGFDDFTAFKEQLMREKKAAQSDAWGSQGLPFVPADDSFVPLVKSWSQDLGAALGTSLGSLDLDTIDELATDIMGYQQVFCYGADLSASFGLYLNSRLSYRRKAVVTSNGSAPRMAPEADRDDTLALLVSQHGNLMRGQPSLFDDLHRLHAKVWLVTQVPRGSFNERVVDRVLYAASTGNGHMDALVLLALAELLAEWCLTK